MYFDNLTIAGLVAISLYALLPLLFGKELLRVQEEGGDRQAADTMASNGRHRALADSDPCPEPCDEAA